MLYATIAVELPEDQFLAAEMLVAIKPIWDKVNADLPDGMKRTTKLDIVETRAKPGPRVGSKRKPKLVAAPEAA
jgi:hypothetical protein